MSYEIKDSGARQEFEGGMVRDTEEGKTDFTNLFIGEGLRRYAEHMTKGRAKYPDPRPGVPNWTLAEGEAEAQRFRRSAARHFRSWLLGEEDEDHLAAVIFNLNAWATVDAKMAKPGPVSSWDRILREIPSKPRDLEGPMG